MGSLISIGIGICDKGIHVSSYIYLRDKIEASYKE